MSSSICLGTVWFFSMLNGEGLHPDYSGPAYYFTNFYPFLEFDIVQFDTNKCELFHNFFFDFQA